MMYAIRHWKNGEGGYLCDSNSGLGWHLGPVHNAATFETDIEAKEMAINLYTSAVFPELGILGQDLWIVMFQLPTVVGPAL